MAIAVMSPATDLTVQTLTGPDLHRHLPGLAEFALRGGRLLLSRHPGWLGVLQDGLGHVPYCLQAQRGDQLVGILPLAYVQSLLFGRFLVSLPYLNYGGPLSTDDGAACSLLDAAVDLADRLKVRYLELRDERAYDHPRLVANASMKVHMRLPLPEDADQLWKKLDAKVRNQVRKGQKSGVTLAWGGVELLDDFHSVFSENMRDLGTPVYGKALFRAILAQFGERTEFGVARLGTKPIACCLLFHGWGVTEVPSGSSLRAFNSTCANMLMYWTMLERACARGQTEFDYGRSSPDSPTFKFKKQWGAQPHPAIWSHFLRQGDAADMRPTNPKYGRAVRIWQKLPLWLTRLVGPRIVRGIP
jgi:FemAB-related protein (PEP-CTERM system-associated)